MNIEQALDTLHGPRERFRAMLEDKDGILASVCDYAEREAKEQGFPPWVIISDITHHGSGVSNAIYQLYRKPLPTEKES